jgi:hypothetical protein
LFPLIGAASGRGYFDLHVVGGKADLDPALSHILHSGSSFQVFAKSLPTAQVGMTLSLKYQSNPRSTTLGTPALVDGPLDDSR